MRNEDWHKNGNVQRTGERASSKAIQCAYYLKEYCSNVKDCSHCAFDQGDCFCMLSSNIPKNWSV